MRSAAIVLSFFWWLTIVSEALCEPPESESCLAEQQTESAVVADALLQSTAARLKPKWSPLTEDLDKPVDAALNQVHVGGTFSLPASGLLVDLRADMGANATSWSNQVPGGPDASVPAWVTYDPIEKAYVLGHLSPCISMPLKTNPDALPSVSFGGWFKLLDTAKQGYMLAQYPDYGMSRAIFLNYPRWGGTSLTTGRWNDVSSLGSADVGQWVHAVGVWHGNGDDCFVYLNGQKESKTCTNGRGSNAEETLMIGGRGPRDWGKNSWCKVAEVFVYDRALSDDEVATLYNDGTRRSQPPAVETVTPAPAPAPTFAPAPVSEAPTPAPWVPAPAPAPGPEPPRSDAEDARFLMQASFGPTRGSMQVLKNMSFADWIHQQMSLPVASHREHYRKHVNNRFNPQYQEYVSPLSPCSKGSRWRRFVFAFTDARKTIEIKGSEKIFVDGVFRSDIDRSTLPSSWVGLTDYTGYICYVDEEIGADVLISTAQNCPHHQQRAMPNPGVWLANGTVDAAGLVLHEAVKPGVLVLQEPAEPCSFGSQSTAGPLAIAFQGEHYLHETRLELLEKTPEQPGTGTCVPQTVINEQNCWVRSPDPEVTEVSGLQVEVYAGRGFVSEMSSVGAPIAAFIDQQINHQPTLLRWTELPILEYFSTRYTGSISVQQGGNYEFSLTSDDGSKLTIDDQLVVDNGGWHGWRERVGSIDLSAGKHALVLEYFNGNGGWGLDLSWTGPDSGGEKAIVPSTAFSTPAGNGTGDCACGSTGEVANDPTEGHHMPFYQGAGVHDQDYDDKYFDRINPNLGKSIVWTMMALKAQDQLRQRMAWSMSQIVVVSTQGIGFDSFSEMWVSFYDIFVRHAFGNYFDILREVAFSPLMGMYLTHTSSSSYDYNGRYPNENFGREIMQLFTIGLDKMNPDGSLMSDAQGQDIPTYTNDQILNFARVLTGFVGQARRPNLEFTQGANLIDALGMSPKMHDRYPKPDLDGNYLGDGYPLCSAGIDAGAFLRKGAVYKFRGFPDNHGALKLHSSSALYAALCHGSEPRCIFPKVHELPETLECSGEECQAADVRFVRVGGADFEFMPPPCVHLFFRDSLVASPAPVGDSVGPGRCVDADGNNVCCERSLGSPDGDAWEVRRECVKRCRAAGARGCELVRGHCTMHTRGGVVASNGIHDHLCWVFSEPVLPHSYVLLPKGVGSCPDEADIDTIGECERALMSLNLSTSAPWVATGHRHVPRGCSYSDTMHWNGNVDPAIGTTGYGHLAPVCRAHVTIGRGGVVENSGGHVKYEVPWVSGAPPAPGTYTVRVETHTVFDRVPSTAEMQQRLKIGASPPSGQCSACDGPIKAYGSEGGVGPKTVFELDGKYFSNAESLVHLPGGAAFRNAPVFMDPIAFAQTPNSEAMEQAALHEVESLLLHLFHHSNTPVFIARRLIQRLVSSNPSPGYIEAVGNAFSSGTHGGKTYSGKYGDLAATLAAVLLHPEARTREAPGTESTSKGSLREPLLKFVHLMRAMDYRDKQRDNVVFSQLQDVIGQFPYQAPTVFSYYLADYELPMPEMGMGGKAEPEPEPEAEAEAEPEPESGMMGSEPEKGLVGPEFQILTPPYLVGYLNGMSNLIKSGVSYDCAPGKDLGVRIMQPQEGSHRNVCPQGELMWQGAGTAAELTQELDVLLTGGRLGPNSKAVVQTAYERAPAGEELRAAQQAAVMTAEFNTLGEPLPKAAVRPAPAAENQSPRRSYKAVVMLFLAGGADTFNMLVPREPALYQEYRDVRSDLALNEHELIDITTEGQSHHTFGIHARLRFLKDLYDSHEAAFVSNVGNLAEPTTRETFLNNQAERCLGLYSHSDQQNAAQTLVCQDVGTAARGIGGRMADALAEGPQKYQTSSFSLAGSAVWPLGVTTQREIVDERGSQGFHAYESWRDTIVNITSHRHGNVYAEAYTQALFDSIRTTETLGMALSGVQLATNYRKTTQLERQLHEVAKLIRAREGRGAERDFFFVSTGGWDMHSNMKELLATRLGEVDDALRGFVGEMKAQGIWDDVVLVTESEFGRTLDSNGGGSDHAWAGNHFVVGGSLSGRRVFNKYPASIRAGNDRDMGRGRMIPEYPWESMMVPISKWLGLLPEQMATAFPNLNRFNATKHIIAQDSFFKASV